MKRRQFLRSSTLATASGIIIPTIIPASALGNNGFTAPSDRILMASIGVGSMGKGNMNSFVKNKDVQIVAVCDLDKKRRESAKNALHKYYDSNDCEAYENYLELLDKEDVDTASIAVPDHWHALLYTEFAKRKIDIYGEKPLVRKIYEGKKVVKAVKDNGIVWQTGSWQRSTENFRRAAEIVANGGIGNITHVDVGLPNMDNKKIIGMPPIQDPPEGIDYDSWLGPVADRPYRGILHWDWRWILDFSGGQLTDWCGHHIDIALWGLKMDHSGPVEISGEGVYKKNNLFDVPFEFDINMKLSNGIPMRVANAAKLKTGMGVCWYGDEGWVHVSRRGFETSSPSIKTFQVPADGTPFFKSPGHHRNFLDCVKSREMPIAGVDVANRAITAGLLGEIAMMTGEKIQWDPQKEELINGSTKAESLMRRVYRTPYKL